MSEDCNLSINEDPEDSERLQVRWAAPKEPSIDKKQSTSSAPAKEEPRDKLRDDVDVEKKELSWKDDAKMSAEPKAKHETDTSSQPPSSSTSLPVFDMGPPKRRFARRNSKVSSMFGLPSSMSAFTLPPSLLSPSIARRPRQRSPPSTAESWLSSLPTDGDTTHQSSEPQGAWWGNSSDPSFSSSLKRPSTPDSNLTATSDSVAKRPRRNSEPWSSPTKRSPPDEEAHEKNDETL